MAQAGKSALAALTKSSVAAMMRNCAPQSAALASSSSPLVSAYDTQRASMASAAAPATKQNAAEFVVTKVRRSIQTTGLFTSHSPSPFLSGGLQKRVCRGAATRRFIHYVPRRWMT